MTLLEVLTALVILGTAGSSLVALQAEAVRAETRAEEEERLLDRARWLLTGLTLLNRQGLDLRLGSHEAEGLVVSVQRPEPTLYRLSVQDSNLREIVLVTVVYRPEIRP